MALQTTNLRSVMGDLKLNTGARTYSDKVVAHEWADCWMPRGSPDGDRPDADRNARQAEQLRQAFSVARSPASMSGDHSHMSACSACGSPAR